MTQLATVEAMTADGTPVIRVSGEIDLSNAATVMDAIGSSVPTEAISVLVDLAGVGYLDSSGIAMLFRLAQRLDHRRQELRLVVPMTSPIRTVLELTNVHRIIPVQESTH